MNLKTIKCFHFRLRGYLSRALLHCTIQYTFLYLLDHQNIHALNVSNGILHWDLQCDSHHYSCGSSQHKNSIINQCKVMHRCTQLGHMAASMFLSGGNYTPLHMHTQCFMCMLTQIVREESQLLDIHTTKSQNIQSTEMLYESIIFSTGP